MASRPPLAPGRGGRDPGPAARASGGPVIIHGPAVVSQEECGAALREGGDRQQRVDAERPRDDRPVGDTAFSPMGRVRDHRSGSMALAEQRAVQPRGQGNPMRSPLETSWYWDSLPPVCPEPGNDDARAR